MDIKTLNNLLKMSDGDQPSYVAFFGVMGATAAMVFSGKFEDFSWPREHVDIHDHWIPLQIVFLFLLALGAAYGTAKSGTGIAAMSVMRPELIMKSIIPVVMAGIIAIYGLVVAVLIGSASKIRSSPLMKDCGSQILTTIAYFLHFYSSSLGFYGILAIILIIFYVKKNCKLPRCFSVNHRNFRMNLQF